MRIHWSAKGLEEVRSGGQSGALVSTGPLDFPDKQQGL